MPKPILHQLDLHRFVAVIIDDHRGDGQSTFAMMTGHDGWVGIREAMSICHEEVLHVHHSNRAKMMGLSHSGHKNARVWVMKMNHQVGW